MSSISEGTCLAMEKSTIWEFSESVAEAVSSVAATQLEIHYEIPGWIVVVPALFLMAVGMDALACKCLGE